MVTIEVSPEQSELVILAEREGKVDLALRNATDVEPADTPGVTGAAFTANAKIHKIRDGEGENEEREAPRKARRDRTSRRVEARTEPAAEDRSGKPIETYNANNRDR